MNKLFFRNDYGEGAHPVVLQRLINTNLEHTCGYGLDDYSIKAADLIREKCGKPEAAVHMMIGGTSANMISLASFMRPYEAAIAAETGHINVHETGAIEHGGHKVLVAGSCNGLLPAEAVQELMELHLAEDGPEHTVQPGMVYISFSSETGTVYSLAQLEAISAVCRRYSLPLFIDGARMGYGLASEGCDVTLKDIARLADVFYIGGTKQGALFGEAVVIVNDALKKDFRYCIKQNGGMLAKGRLLGLQFIGLFEDGLYFRLSEHAVTQALRIRDAFKAIGCEFLVHSPGNQQFPILDNALMDALSAEFQFSVWKKIDVNRTAVRFCTSWATQPEAVDALISALQ